MASKATGPNEHSSTPRYQLISLRFHILVCEEYAQNVMASVSLVIFERLFILTFYNYSHILR